MRDSRRTPADFDPTFLDEDQLSLCLREMRQRGWAVAAYNIDDIATMVDGWATQPNEAEIRTWFDKDYLEDLMCSAVGRAVDAWIEDLAAEPPPALAQHPGWRQPE